MDAAQWPQGFACGVQEVGLVKPNMEELTIMSSSSSSSNNTSASTNPRQTANIQQLQVAYNMVERRLARPQKEQALHCPRCSSTSTKFCYYNNYSLTQPRYFCKACRRYWTEGGSLRNVPVGGGSRKNKKSSAAASSSSSSTSLPTLAPPPIICKKIPSDDFESPGFQDLQGQDLNLAFPMPCTGTSTMGLSLNPFVPLLHPMASSSEFYRANASSFPNYDVTVGATSGGSRGGGGRVLFPFEETRAQELNVSINANNADVKGQNGGGGDHPPSTGFWSGMLGGGGSSSW